MSREERELASVSDINHNLKNNLSLVAARLKRKNDRREAKITNQAQ